MERNELRGELPRIILEQLFADQELVDEEGNTDRDLEEAVRTYPDWGPKIVCHIRNRVQCWDDCAGFTHGAGRRAWIVAMARLGGLDEFNPKSYYSRRPKTAVVDGIRYVVG